MFNFREKFEAFYIQNYLKIFQLYEREEFASYVLLLIRFIQQISLIFSLEFFSHIDSSNNNSAESQLIDYAIQFLEGFRFSFVIDSNETFKIIVKVILFSLNTILLIWFFLLIMTERQVDSFIYKLISFYMKIFYYVIFIPQLTLSAYFITEYGGTMKVISILSTIEDIFIVIVICYHDNSLQFDYKDHLFKFNPFQFYIQIPLISISSLIVYTHNSFFVNSILLLISTLAELAEIVRNGGYTSIQMGLLNAKLSFVTLVLCFICAVQMLNSDLHANSVSSLFVIIPITWRLSTYIYNAIITQYAKKLITPNDGLNKTNIWIRIMFRICKENELTYFNSENGVIIESLISQHTEKCILQPSYIQKSCYCSQFKEQLLQKDKYQQDVVRRNFIFNIIEENFRLKLSKKKVSDYFTFRLSYINFLLQALQCPIKTQLEIKKLYLNKNKLSLRNLSLLNQIDDISSNNIYGKKKFRKDDFQNAIMFDTRITQLNQSSRKSYVLKRDFFEFLSQSTIDIKELFTKGSNLYKQMKSVEYEIYKLMSINSLSKRLNEVTSLFMSVFDLRRKEMRKQNIISQRHMMNSYAHSSSIKQDMSLDLFSTRNSCVINISLLNSLGEIKECTKSVQQIFMMTQKEVIGKNISVLMPSSIGDEHNKILQRYIANENQYHLQNEKKYFFLGQDRLGQIIPLKAQMQLLVKPNDFCVVSFLSKINNTNHYILFSRDTNKSHWIISNISKSLNQYLLPLVEVSQHGKNILKNVCFEKIVPLMTTFEGFRQDQKVNSEEDFWSTEQTTILFHPKNLQQFNFLSKNRLKAKEYDSEAFSKLIVALLGDNFGCIEIKFINKILYDKIYYMEITSIRFIKRHIDRNDSILFLINQLNKALFSNKIDLNLNEIKGIIDIIKQQQSLLDIPEDVNLKQFSSLMNQQVSFIKSEIQNSNQHLESSLIYHKNDDKSYEYVQEYYIDKKNPQIQNKDMDIIEEDQFESNKNHKSSLMNNHLNNQNYSFNVERRAQYNNLQEIVNHQDDYFVEMNNEEYGDVIHQDDFQLESTARKDNITNRELLIIQPSDTNRDTRNKIHMEPNLKAPKNENLNTSQIGVSQNVSYINNFEELNDISRQNKFQDLNHENNRSVMDLSSINLMKQQNDISHMNHTLHQNDKSHANAYTIDKNDSFNKQTSSQIKKNDQASRSTTLNSQINQQISLSSQNKDSKVKQNNRLSLPHNNSLNYFDHSQNEKPFPELKINKDSGSDSDDEQQEEREQTEKLQSEKDKESSLSNNFNMNQGFENINPDALVDQSNSSKTKTELSSTKRRIAYIITSKRQNILIKSINYFGYAALLILSFITLFVYFTLESNLDTMLQNLQQMTRGTDLMQSSSFAIVNKEIVRADSYDAFYTKLTTERQQHFIESYQQSLSDFRNQVNSLDVAPNKFGFSTYVNVNQLNVTEVNEDGTIQEYKEEIVIYAISNYFYNLQQYTTLDNVQNRAYVLRNFLVYQDVYEQIRDLTFSDANASNENIQSILRWTFILIELVSAVNIFMIIPIYYKVQTYREEILRLFATFPKEKLMSMISYMNRIINSRFYKSHSSGGVLSSGRLSSNNFYKDNAFKNSHIKWKNKVISNTTNLNKFHWGIFSLCIAILIFISVYPTINYSVTHPYLDQLLVFFSEFLTLQKTKSQVCFAYAISIMRLTCAIENKTDLMKELDNYQSKYLNSQNTQMINQLSSIPGDFETITRYHEDQQKLLLLQPLSSSICQFMKDLEASSLFNTKVAAEPDEFEDCWTVYSGLLTKGMIITVKQSIAILNELYSVVSSASGTALIPIYKEWDQAYSIPNFDHMDDLNLSTVDVISSYLMVQYQDLFDLLYLVQYILLAYSLTVLICSFFFGWRSFIEYSNAQIVQTRILLSILNIDNIVDNSYIFSYFKKQFGQQ